MFNSSLTTGMEMASFWTQALVLAKLNDVPPLITRHCAILRTFQLLPSKFMDSLN